MCAIRHGHDIAHVPIRLTPQRPASRDAVIVKPLDEALWRLQVRGVDVRRDEVRVVRQRGRVCGVVDQVRVGRGAAAVGGAVGGAAVAAAAVVGVRGEVTVGQ